MAWVAIFLVCNFSYFRATVRIDKSFMTRIYDTHIVYEIKGEIDFFFFFNLKGNLVRGLD